MYSKKRVKLISIFYFIALAIFLIAFNTNQVFAADCGGVTPCACGDFLVSSYTMTQDLNCNVTALHLFNNDLTLDCDGYSIIKNGSDIIYGLYGISKCNITIKNCVIKNFNEGIDYQILTESNSTFQNNTLNNNTIGMVIIANKSLVIKDNLIYNGEDGIYLTDSFNVTIANNTIFNQSKRGIAILTGFRTENNTIKNNTIYNASSSLFGYGSINIEDSSYNLISYNNISNGFYGIQLKSNGIDTKYNLIVNNTITNSSQYGIYCHSNCQETNITGNYINGTLVGMYIDSTDNFISENTLYKAGEIEILSSGHRTVITKNNLTFSGISISDVNYVNISNNTIHSDLSTDAITLLRSVSARIYQNNISNNYRGINIRDTDENYFYKNNFSNNYYGIHLMEGSRFNHFEKSYFLSNTEGIYSESSSDDNQFVNIDLNNDSFVIQASGGSNQTLINSSFEKDNLTVSNNATLFVKWFLDVHVNTTTGIDLFGINVTAFNNTNLTEATGTTDSNGDIRFVLTEFIKYESDINYHTPHIINATSTTKYNQTTINLTKNNSDVLYLQLNLTPSSCGYVNENYNLLTNLNNNGTCLIINSSNIIINGNGGTIEGNGTGIGINISNFWNITIKNLQIKNYSTGIYGLNSSNNNFYLNTITLNGDGIKLVNYSNNSNISYNTITYNLKNGSIILNSTNNTIYNNIFNNTNNSFDDSTNRYNITKKCETTNILSGNCIGGNRWSNYDGEDNRLDGIGDTSRTILGGTNQDYLPLVLIPESSCGTISSNTILPKTTLTTDGTCFTVSSSNIIIDGNGATIIGDGGTNDKGFSLVDLNNVTIKNITIKEFDYGIYTDNTGGSVNINHSFINNTILNVSTAIYLDSGSYSTIKNNILNGSSYGLYATQHHNSYFYNNEFSGIAAIYLHATTDNIFVNGKINSTNSDLYILTGGSGTTNLINVTFDRFNMTVPSSNYVYVKWYTKVNITNTSKSPLQNVKVSGINTQKSIENYSYTNSKGMATLALTEFYEENNVKYYLTSNHSIITSAAGYQENSTEINLVNISSYDANLSIKDVECGISLTRNAILGSNINTNGNCFELGTNNLTINGNGYYLTGNYSGVGIKLNGYSQINITNLTIRNFTRAILVNRSNNTKLGNLTIVNNSQGMVVLFSENTKIYDSIFDNNSNWSIFTANAGGTNTSLINVSVNISKLNATGTSNIFIKWYVNVNVTLNGNNIAIQGANATGIRNDSILDDSKLTGQDGIVRLELTEIKVNSTGAFNVTPTLINVTYQDSTGLLINTTIIDLRIVNNTQVNLSLSISCTIPVDDLNLTRDSILCPGTYDIEDNEYTGSIIIGESNLNITCDNTIINCKGCAYQTGIGIYAKEKENITMDGCEINDYGTNIYFEDIENFNVTNIVLRNSTGNNGGLRLINSTNNNFSYFNFSFMQNGIFLESSSSSNIFENGRITSDDSITGNKYGVYLIASTNNNFTNISIFSFSYNYVLDDNSNSNRFKNITSSSSTGGFEIISGIGNYLYHSTFSSNTNNILDFVGGNFYNITIQNASGHNFTQGNEFDDYCNKGSDLDGDGYADNISSYGAQDYPYNYTGLGSLHKFYGIGADYGPKITTCVTSVFLGSSSGGGGSSSTSTGAATVATNPASSIPFAQKEEVPIDFYDANEAKKHLVTYPIYTSESGDILNVKITLENTGTKLMRLFPEILQDVEDPFYIIKWKTFNQKNSLFHQMTGMYQTGNQVAKELLKAKIENPEPLILQPGEKKETQIPIKMGIVPRNVQLKFTTFGEDVAKKDVANPQQAISLTAVDLHTENNLIDLYSVVVPSELSQKLQEYYQGNNQNAITGNAITNFESTNNIYEMEVEIKRKADNTIMFTDIYGPYKITSTQTLVFAQQFSYESKPFYPGEYTIKMVVYKDGKKVIENEIPASLN